MTMLLKVAVFIAAIQGEAYLPSIEVRPSSTNVSIGERFQVTVEARGPSGMTFEFPKTVSDGSIELTQSRSASSANSIAVYDAQIFAIGESAKVPEIEIAFKTGEGAQGTARSRPVPLNVVSVLDPAEQDPAPADFAPPQPVLVSRAFWVAGAIAGAIIVGLFILLARRLRFPKKPADPVVAPALTPEDAALQGLESLASRVGTIEPKAFFIQLVQILKGYLEVRLEAPVLEMTSTETLSLVKAHAWTAPHAPALRELISSADLAKFGGASHAVNAEAHIQLVRDVVARIDRLRRSELDRASRDQERRKTA
jgi:hypothetical protein